MIFPVNIAQLAIRVASIIQQLRDQTDRKKTRFTNKSSFVLGNRQWVWRRRGKTGPGVSYLKSKFPPNVNIFAGIAHQYKSHLIILESRVVDGEGYVGEFLDETGVIPDMNAQYGSRRRT
jgi:hypothetical protein